MNVQKKSEDQKEEEEKIKHSHPAKFIGNRNFKTPFSRKKKHNSDNNNIINNKKKIRKH
jgi:hypothetical protein